MGGVIGRTSRRRRRRGGAIAVLLLLIAAGVAIWLLWRRRDHEYARLVTEPDRPDLEPAPMPTPPEPIVDDVPDPVKPGSQPDFGRERTPLTASIPASAVPPTMVEEIRSELETAAAPVAATTATEGTETAPAFTMPPLVEPTEIEDAEEIVADALVPVIESEATVDDEISEDEVVVAEPIDHTVANVEAIGEAAEPTVEDEVEAVTLEEAVLSEVVVEASEEIVASDDAVDIVGAPTTEKLASDLVEEVASEPTDLGPTAAASLEEAVDDLVSSVPAFAEAFAEVPVPEIEADTVDDEVSEVQSVAAPVAERLDQVLLAHEPLKVSVDTEIVEVEAERDEVVESVDEIVNVASDAAAEVIEAGPVESAETSALQAIVSASESETEVETPVKVEDPVEATGPTASTIPPWPGTAEAQEESTPLTASDAPSPPPLPTEAERNGPRPGSDPSRSRTPSNPSGAPFRGGSDQLPASRSWPTLPR